MQQQKGIIALENVSFHFAGQQRPFFSGLNLEFPARAIHFIQGQNGAGKSTFFSILQGSVQPRERLIGSITIDGQKLVFDGQDQAGLEMLKSDVKMVQQAFDLMIADQLSFGKNLQAAAMGHYPSLAGLPSAKPMPTFIERFRIDMRKPVYQLSGGQRQILAILMALQKPAKVLLLDEPTAALDQENSQMVMEFLHDLVGNGGLTVLIISHDRDLFNQYAKHGHYQITVASDGTRGVRFAQGVAV